jgi:hypothetical protein
MIQVFYKSKKDLKASVGQALVYRETSMFSEEFKRDGKFPVADGMPARKWFAEVTMSEGKIAKVT